MHITDFSLVLSGGGALGIAHLGVLEDMETLGLKPCEVIGTSMGGIIAACVAVGMKEKEIYLLIEEFSRVFNWVKFSFKGNSIIKCDKIEEIFSSIFKNKKIKETLIPLKIIATNLTTTQTKVFDSDDDVLIKDALLATMAIPGIFEEKTIKGEVYVDGFLSENLGVKQAGSDTVIAVDVLGKNSFSTELPNYKSKTKNMINMFEKSLRILIYNQTKEALKSVKDKNIILIEPETKNFKTYQFHRYAEIKSCAKGLVTGILDS